MLRRHHDRTLRVDPITCEGHALCIEAFPEMITADPWNYPVLNPHPIPDHLLRHAEHAVKVCPVLALRIVTSSRDSA
ncbi:ferredoxin [Catenulispora sp. EB89]|uniref:ferredoxin n=1 Tax=Catenulispora sp. EB89 TaxID=3156257 RepID=UPI0035176322